MNLTNDGKRVIYKLQGCVAEILSSSFNNVDYAEVIRVITEMLVVTNMSLQEQDTIKKVTHLRDIKNETY